MDTDLLKNMIAVVRSEEFRRAAMLEKVTSEYADDRWLFIDKPFVDELALVLMLALRRRIEAELVRLAARADRGVGEVDSSDYQREIYALMSTRKCLATVKDRLGLESNISYKREMEALRLLANCYKHSPSMEPEKNLLRLLGLKIGIPYAALPESHAVQERLADLVGLSGGASYCDIAERFVDIAAAYLKEVEHQNQAKLCRVRTGFVSLNPETFAR